MNHSLTDQDQNLMDFEALPIQAVALSQQHYDQAVEISDRVVTEARQWKTYLNALALFGFQTWFTQQAPDLSLDWQHCSLYQPQYANLIEAAYDLRVNDLKICLISIGGSIDSLIKLPRAIVDLPGFQAHMYVVVRVFEEQGQVQVLSFLRHEQWLAYQQAQPLRPAPDWSYQVPTDWFDANLHRLLLQCQCLKPEPLETVTQPSPNADTLRAALRQRLAQAGSVETPLWQVLSWPEGAALLTSPTLVNWLYEVQTGRIPLPSPAATSPLQPMLNVGAWLRNELDELAQTLGWILLPPLAELRSPDAMRFYGTEQGHSGVDLQAIIDEMAIVRRQLNQEGKTLPADTRCVYKALNLAATPLGLYAMTWPLPDNTEWELLLVLKTLPGNSLNSPITLTVKDTTQPLVEGRLAPDTKDNSIYAHVAGSGDDIFQVTLTADTGETLALPPFSFPQEG